MCERGMDANRFERCEKTNGMKNQKLPAVSGRLRNAEILLKGHAYALLELAAEGWQRSCRFIQSDAFNAVHGIESGSHADFACALAQRLLEKLVKRIKVDAAQRDSLGADTDEFTPDLFAWRNESGNDDAVRVDYKAFGWIPELC